MNRRTTARALAKEAIERGEPLAWFERLYQLAETSGVAVPWADRCPNPNLIDLVSHLPKIRSEVTALKVGCGIGDDAEWMAAQGWSTTAFDISPTAIATCRKRFPNSRVSYSVADLLHVASEWSQRFDVVQESYTLQVLPPTLRPEAIACIAQFVSRGGLLLLVTRGKNRDEPTGEMPWPLTEQEVLSFRDHSLQLLYFRDYLDNESPPIRRFQACFLRR